MAWDLARQEALSTFAPVAEVRKIKLEATQRLLGDTISLSERAWQEPGRLPGWTRAHVATHLARNADAFVRAIDSVLTGRRGLMYDSDDDRELAIERGSERSGLELQIDLDTSAGNLSERLDLLDSVPGRLTVELSPGTFLRSDLLPLARLYEVIIHHVDLDCGFEVSQINPLTARWLLEWSVLSYQQFGDRDQRTRCGAARLADRTAERGRSTPSSCSAAADLSQPRSLPEADTIPPRSTDDRTVPYLSARFPRPLRCRKRELHEGQCGSDGQQRLPARRRWPCRPH